MISVLLGFAFPIDDWQFWIATLLSLLALIWLVRGAIPWRVFGRKKGSRATLTIEGKPTSSKSKRSCH